MDALMKRLDEASYDGDVAKLKELLQEDPLLLDTVLTEVRSNPLHIAALKNHVEFTREVLQLKPELASQLNREGQSPLHLAAARGHLQVAQVLVDKVGTGICRIRETNYGYMPVHIATVNRKLDVVRMLVERCKDTLEEATDKLETLLHLAVKANCLDSIGYLIDQGINLDEKDAKGNTCLHLAVAKPNRQVIKHLLDLDNIEINSINEMGLTPLDVLLASPLYSDVDISDLAVTMQSAGGMRSTELIDLESNKSSSVVVGTPPPRNQRLSRGNRNMTKEKLTDAQTLLIVATLVAAMTFQAITNPPGGFVGAPIEKSDTLAGIGDTTMFESSSWFKTWEIDGFFPVGRPVLLWRLTPYFALDSLAFFSSVCVILCLLIAEPKSKVVMKFLVAIVWFSAFCTALAFGCAFLAMYAPHPVEDDVYKKRFRWVWGLLMACFCFYVIAGFWATILVLEFLWQKAGFERKLPNSIAQLRWLKDDTGFRRTIAIVLSWLKGSKQFKRIYYGTLMVCAVGAFLVASIGLYLMTYFAISSTNDI